MKAQFYKIIPCEVGIKRQKPLFVWIDNPSEERLHFLHFSSSSNFVNGTKEIVPADKNDKEFQDYVLLDITQVQKELD